MVVPFVDTATGTPVYLNPTHVLSVRPDPTDPDNTTVVKLEDGESLRVRGDHAEIAKKLTLPS